MLKRVVSVLKFLSERGLAIFGDNQTIGSPHIGNFLGTIELLAQYDNFLAVHIEKHANKFRGHNSYLSVNVITEFIALMCEKVLHEIVYRIKKS